MRFPGGLLFGAMAGSGLLHGAGLVQVTLPWWAGSAAVLTLGAVAGARFANTSPRMLLDYLGAAFGSFAVAAAVASSFALIVVALLPLRITDVVVAFAPGAQDTMMVLALALHLDPVYVGAHHLVRFLIVTIAVAVAARRMGPPSPPRRALEAAGAGDVRRLNLEGYSAASARSLRGRPSRSQTSTSASASASISASS